MKSLTIGSKFNSDAQENTIIGIDVVFSDFGDPPTTIVNLEEARTNEKWNCSSGMIDKLLKDGYWWLKK